MESSFESRVAEFAQRWGLFPEGRRRVTVGLSGGADSVALLAVLTRFDLELSAAHCNFGLRGEESERDEAFCRTLCRDLGVALTVRRFEVEAERARTGASMEMACRTLRYDWWRSMIEEGMTDCIAVGHHREDNEETLFLNLFRGAGLRGLKGMLPVVDAECLTVRPLLDMTRREIEQYLDVRSLTYVTDSTNLENDARRNRLRNVILPFIEREWPGALEGVDRSMAQLRDNYILYEQKAESLRSRYVRTDGVIEVVRLVSESSAPEVALFEIMRGDGISIATARDIVGALSSSKGAGGQRFEIGEKTYELHRGMLVETDEAVAESRVIASLDEYPFDCQLIDREKFQRLLKSPDANRAFFSLDILEGNPTFELRTPLVGDRIAPFGMKGTKLLSDLLKDLHLTSAQRRVAPVVTRNGVIIWMPGIRHSSHFSVKPDAEKILMLTFIP